MARVGLRTKQGTGGEKSKAAEAGKEWVIAEAKGVDITPENAIAQIDCNAVITTVAEDTEIILRIRRSSLTGTEVVKVTTKPGASTKVSIGIQAQDEPGEQAGLAYVLTAESVAKKASESEKSTIQVTY